MIIDVGPYKYRLSNVPASLHAELVDLYGSAASSANSFVDFDIQIKSTSLIRRFVKPQVVIEIEGQQPFNPIPPSKLLPSIEWAMNWCVAAYDHSKLLFHSGVAVKNNQAILFPAQSGSGKSTLSTYLGLNGWRLYSDEMAIIDLNTLKVHPVFRPSSLKNQSITIISELFPNATISSITKNTHKGDIAHAQTNDYSRFKAYEACDICAVVFLNYEKQCEQKVEELEKAVGFSHMLLNAFNYSVIGEPAFHALAALANQVRFFDTTYSDMAFVDDFASDIANRNID